MRAKLNIMPRSKGFALVEILISIIIIGIFAFAFYFWTTNQTNPTLTPTPSPTSTPITYQTFVNQMFNFSFSFPTNFELAMLSDTDYPETVEIETGEEGTFVVEKSNTQGVMDKTYIVSAQYLPTDLKDLSLTQLVTEHGSFGGNYCFEDLAGRSENVSTDDGITGIKVWYWIKAGCQGAEERIESAPYIFFKNPDESRNIIFYLFAGDFVNGRDTEIFNKAVQTFKFIPPNNYSDN